MALSEGGWLNHYEILSHLGTGGMGEVYRAHDNKLQREVALKVLPKAFAQDPERLARFRREAQVLAQVNHPNIAGIYSVEESGGTHFLVMELAEGETLRDRIKRGPVPIEEALDIAKQIAAGLEAAHEKPIVHRDLKPANIKVTPEGVVKILDFGLARAFAGDSASSDPSDSPTLTGMTTPGTILGTAAYMSPEQARGKKVDKRTDIWAFGCVLYEMLTGKRAFEGEDVQDILAGVMRGEPDWTALPASTPPNVRFVLRRCLEKDPKRRLSSAADLQIQLEEARSAPAAQAAASSSAAPRFAWGIAAIAVVVALALAALYFSRRSVPPETVRFAVSSSGGLFNFNVVSPDGRSMAFTGKDQSGRLSLWIRRLDSLETQPLPGTENIYLGSPPFWSPDSRFLGFFAEGKLKKVEVSSGLAQTLADAPNGRGGAWNPDGVILFAPQVSSGLFKVSAAGGAVSPATTPNPALGEENHHWPKFLPDGRHFLFLSGRGDPKDRGIYVGSLDSNETKRLLTTHTEAAYAPPGYLLFLQGDTLMAQPFDAARLEMTGDPAAVAEAVDNNPLSGSASFSVSEGGILTYANSGERNTQLAWFDRNGKKLGTLGSPFPSNFESNPELSPDGKTVAVSRGPLGADDLWLWDVVAETSSRFTFDPARDNSAQWSPDGRHIVFKSTRNNGRNDLYQKDSSGSGTEDLFFENPGTPNLTAQDWSSDGRFILYMDSQEKTRLDLWVLPLEGDRKPFPYLETPANESEAQFSPDGHWVAYASDESGRPEVYIQSFPKTGSKRQVSTNGGAQPRWRGDGRELYYLAPDLNLMAAPVRAGTIVEVGPPTALFQTSLLFSELVPAARQQYDVTADGQRFLLLPQPELNAKLVVVLNWSAELQR